MLFLLFQPNFSFLLHLFYSTFGISDFNEQGLYLLLKSSTLGLEHLPNCGFLLNELLDLVILSSETCLQLFHLILQAFSEPLMVQLHLLDLGFMHFVELAFQVIDLQLGEPFSLQHFHSDSLILFSQQVNCLLKVCFLLCIFCCKVLDFPISGIQVLSEPCILSLQRVQARKMVFLESLHFFNIVQLQFMLQSL